MHLKMNGLIVILVKEERYGCIYFNPLNQVYEALEITHCITLMKTWNHPLHQVDNDDNENLESPFVSSGFVH